MTENQFAAKSPYSPPGPRVFGAKGDPGRVLLHLIDRMEMLVGNAMKVPGTSRVLVDRAELLDLVWVDNGPQWMAARLRSAEAVLALQPDFVAMDGLKLGVVGAYPAGSPQ